MATKKPYTLAMFAEALYPDKVAAEGWARGNREHIRRKFLRHYRAQCAWNDRMVRMLADETPWQDRAVPVADYSPKGMRAYCRSQLASPWHKEMAALLETDGQAYWQFRRACHKAAP